MRRTLVQVGTEKHVLPVSRPASAGAGQPKSPVVALVETNGKAHSHPVDRVDAATLKTAMETCIDPSARIITDELRSYPKATSGFAGGHETVCHGAEEYVNPLGFHTNTAESYFALLKRGVYGTFHHVSKQRLHRYCNEFSFRWNWREVKDRVRCIEAIRGSEGKRLKYKNPLN